MVMGAPNHVHPIRAHGVPSHGGKVEIRKTPCLGDRFQATAAAGRRCKTVVMLQRVTIRNEAVMRVSAERPSFHRAGAAFPGIGSAICASPCVPAHSV